MEQSRKTQNPWEMVPDEPDPREYPNREGWDSAMRAYRAEKRSMMPKVEAASYRQTLSGMTPVEREVRQFEKNYRPRVQAGTPLRQIAKEFRNLRSRAQKQGMKEERLRQLSGVLMDLDSDLKPTTPTPNSPESPTTDPSAF